MTRVSDDALVAVAVPVVWPGPGPAPMVLMRQRDRSHEVTAAVVGDHRIERLPADPITGNHAETPGELVQRVAELHPGEPVVLVID